MSVNVLLQTIRSFDHSIKARKRIIQILFIITFEFELVQCMSNTLRLPQNSAHEATNRQVLMTDFFEKSGVAKVLGVASLERVASNCSSVPVSKALSILKGIPAPSDTYNDVEVAGYGKHIKSITKGIKYSTRTLEGQILLIRHVQTCGLAYCHQGRRATSDKHLWLLEVL